MSELSGSLVRVEFTPNVRLAFPKSDVRSQAATVYLADGKAKGLRPGESLTVEDISISVANTTTTSRNGDVTVAEVLRVRTAGWAINATARLIWRSVVRGKRQVIGLAFARATATPSELPSA